jgi:hypothetical protein
MKIFRLNQFLKSECFKICLRIRFQQVNLMRIRIRNSGHSYLVVLQVQQEYIGRKDTCREPVYYNKF